MSGLFRGLGKIFKGVVKIAKKIAIPALIAGGILFSGGALLGAAPVLAGGAATAGTAASSVAAATGGGGGLAGWLGGLFGGGGGGAAAGAAAGGAGGAAGGGGLLAGLGRILNSPLAGTVIQGAAAGFGRGAEMKEGEEQSIRGEQRAQEVYTGSADALAWDNPVAPVSRGLAPQEAPVVADATRPVMRGLQPMAVPVAPVATVVAPPVPMDVASAPAVMAPPVSPFPAAGVGARYRFNPATGQIDYA